MESFITDSLKARQAAMRDVWSVYDAHFAEVAKASLEALEAIPELKAVVAELQTAQDSAGAAERQERSRALLKAAMVDGDWDTYLADIRRSGAEYARAGLDFSVWSAVILGFRSVLLTMLKDAYGSDADRFAAAADALGAFLDAAIAVIGDEYLGAREEIIKHQLSAIRELSTPVLRVRSGLLVLPLIGIIDTDRARRLTASLLATIRSDRARVVILDLTGVPAVDSAVANHLIMAAKAARLLGATAIITGLSTANAETLARLGVDLGEVQTLADLETGIQESERLLAGVG
ncbi:MAG TPA: STAS domain-containing protein [Candidatus Micrarchaeaceae archaeon]|nr:STAS domain-containing protein [Candidatus Micrarchaeaceae archaeon]